MRSFGVIALLAVTACGGGDTPNDESAAFSAANAASRDAAQESRIDNPDAFACLQANASEEEWAIILLENESSQTTLQTVLNREGTIRCFNENNVTVFL